MLICVCIVKVSLIYFVRDKNSKVIKILFPITFQPFFPCCFNKEMMTNIVKHEDFGTMFTCVFKAYCLGILLFKLNINLEYIREIQFGFLYLYIHNYRVSNHKISQKTVPLNHMQGWGKVRGMSCFIGLTVCQAMDSPLFAGYILYLLSWCKSKVASLFLEQKYFWVI